MAMVTVFRYLDQEALLPLIWYNFHLPNHIKRVVQDICCGTQISFKISAGILSPPVAFPFLSSLTVFLISFLDTLPQLILSSSSHYQQAINKFDGDHGRRTFPRQKRRNELVCLCPTKISTNSSSNWLNTTITRYDFKSTLFLVLV